MNDPCASSRTLATFKYPLARPRAAAAVLQSRVRVIARVGGYLDSDGHKRAHSLYANVTRRDSAIHNTNTYDIAL